MRINRPKHSEVTKPVKSATEPKETSVTKSDFSGAIELLKQAASSLGETAAKSNDEDKKFCKEQLANISVIIMELKAKEDSN